MAEDGEDKLIAVARHIAKTLGRTETMTDDILQIFSTFDGRFSREKFSESHEDGGSDDEHLPFSSIDHTVRSLDRQISRFISSDRPIWSDSADASAFLGAVDALLAAARELDPADPGDKPLFDHADDLIQQCMLRLEDEFRSLIEHPEGAPTFDPIPSGLPGASPFDSEGEDSDDEDDLIPVAQPVPDYNIVIDALPSGAAADLHEIATRMVAAGFGRELAHAYSLARQGFLEESVARLGFRLRPAEEVQGTPWPDLEDEISRWVRAVNVAFRILFPSERRLCDRVFAGLTPVADLSFAEACRAPAIRLLGFADAVAVGSRAPERLFRVVDMYEALRDLVPELDGLFSDQYSSFLRSEAGAICKALGAAIRGIFMELENLIRRDPAKGAVPGGGLHPITRYVMNYLRAACASRRTLEEVMMEEEAGAAAAAATADLNRLSSSLAVQIEWIMEVLQSNLEAKSKIYKDPSLSCIFLMNNGRYIIQKARDGELGLLLGDDWIRRQTARVRRWSGDYQRSTWGKVAAVLRTDGGGGPAPAGGKAMRERLRMFNGYLEEICGSQAGWVVVDEQLRAELRASTAELVLPAYRSFLGRSVAAVEAGKPPEKHVKYSAEDVEARIGNLFEGNWRKS